MLGFYINLPTGGLAILLFILVVNLPPTKEVNTPRMSVVNRIRKLDPIGFLLFAPAAVQLILALEMGGNQHRWGSATIIGLFCGAFGTILAFIAWEYHMGDGAMIPLSIIRRRVIWSSCINYAFFVGSMMSATYYLPIYFQSVRNASPLISGVDLLPMIIATSLATIVTGILSKAHSNLWIYLWLLTSDSFTYWILPSFCYLEWSHYCHRHGTHLDIYTNNYCWNLDWISNSHGHWSWIGISNSNNSCPEQHREKRRINSKRDGSFLPEPRRRDIPVSRSSLIQ